MNVAVIGAGTMGVGIAWVFAAQAENEVLLCSSSRASAQKGRETLAEQLADRVRKRKMEPEQAEGILGRVWAGDLPDCADSDIVIESVREDLAAKQALFSRLAGICRADCIFASNTSSLSVTEIGREIPQSVIGMHFFNPAPVMRLVEVTPSLNTTTETTEQVMAVARSVGKTAIQVKEHAGMVVNRLLIPMINEAVELYDSGVASAEDIDAALRLGANHPMGPLQLGDLIGLDIVLAIMEALQAETGDSKYRPHPLLRKMVRGGWLGRKSGKGFYRYETPETGR